MPFIAVSFANHDHTNVLHEKAQSTLSRIDAEISFISHLLCIHSPSLSHKKMYSAFQWIQKIYFFLLVALLTTALIFIFFIKSSIFLLIFISSLIDLSLLLWWNQSSVHDRFSVCLLEATAGVGSVKRRKTIQTNQKFTFLTLLIISIFYMFVFILSSFFLSDSSSHQFNPLIFYFILTLSLSICFFSTIAAMILFTTRLSLISSEFHTHSDDFLTDGNTFQTCVSKHYALIHAKIINIFSKVRLAFSFWLSLHTLLLFVYAHFFLKNLLHILNSARPFPQEPIEIILDVSRDLLLPLFIPLTRFILSFASIYRLQVASKRFSQHLVSLLCTENKIINDQTYLVCMTYSSHLQSSFDHHLSFCGLLLNCDYLSKISIGSLLLLFLIHFDHI